MRALLGLKPLQVKVAAVAAAVQQQQRTQQSPPHRRPRLLRGDWGPTLPASGAAPKPSASGKELKQQEAARGPEAVLAVSLSRYTKERPVALEICN